MHDEEFSRDFSLGFGSAILLAAAQAWAADAAPPEPRSARFSDLMSLPVYGTGNEKLGKIEDLVADPTSGKISYAVLSFGGILGMGDKYFAVPWNDVKVFYKGTTSAGTQKEVYATVDVSKEALKKRPGFDKNHWPNFADQTFARDLESFYGTNRAASKILDANTQNGEHWPKVRNGIWRVAGGASREGSSRLVRFCAEKQDEMAAFDSGMLALNMRNKIIVNANNLSPIETLTRGASRIDVAHTPWKKGSRS